MLSIEKTIDFTKVYAEYSTNNPVDKDQPQIKAGEIKEDGLIEFIENKLTTLKFRIYLYSDCAVFTENTLPDEKRIFYLERAVIFGEKGSFEIRRKGDGFSWNFIGQEDLNINEGNDFFSANINTTFKVYDGKILLWGKSTNKDGNFFEDRVAQACPPLKYPIKAERAYLCYKKYVRDGCTEFIRYTGLEGQ